MTEAVEYIVLCPEEGCIPTKGEIEAVLDAAGFCRWGGNGFPSLVVFAARSGKGDYFEAGYWAGAGVPLFFLGGGQKRTVRRGHIVQRFRGWNVAEGLSDLLGAIVRAHIAAKAPA